MKLFLPAAAIADLYLLLSLAQGGPADLCHSSGWGYNGDIVLSGTREVFI